MGEIDSNPVAGASKLSGSELERYHEVMRAHDLTELEIREGSLYIKLSRATAPAPVVTPLAGPLSLGTAPTPAAAPKKNFPAITSPLAGIFYRAPSPSAPSFVKEGDKAAFGDIVCIVEAMKVMNEIRSDRPGVIHKILAENGKPVSAGQELFQIEPL
jgi:acetyl-CoA carboxylase biotin carboxyl carrier protein